MLFVLVYLEMQSIFFFGADFADFPKSNSITLVSESACSFWNSLRQEYKLGWCFFESPNFIASIGTAKGSKTFACRIQKVRILEVQGWWFVNARGRIFHCTHGTLHGCIQHKHSSPFARSIVAYMAPCTLVLCSGTLHLLQDPRCTVVPAPWNRKIRKWEEVHPLLHIQHSAPQLSAVAPYTLCRIHPCFFYNVYPALNSKFLSQKAWRSRSRPFARIQLPKKNYYLGKRHSGYIFLVKKFRVI